ncbi:MAG: hypothetical protein L6Q97_19205 [Thermoanaerobaculia bacterium]|nr:hypothetical protein [Thermoanaerobaculia bacterium]
MADPNIEYLLTYTTPEREELVMKSSPRQVYKKAGFETVEEASIDFEPMKEEERGLWVMMRRIY